MSKKIIIGVMGPGKDATPEENQNAYELGKFIARQNWIVLTGGVNSGIMHHALKGAKAENPDSTTIGILPHRGEPEKTSECADIIIPTGMGEGRNNLNILTSTHIISCCNDPWKSPGTFSEILFAIKFKKPIIGLHVFEDNDFYRNIYLDIFSKFSERGNGYEKQGVANNPEDAMNYLFKWIK